MSQENEGLRSFDIDSSLTLPVPPYLRVKQLASNAAVALAGPLDDTIGTTQSNALGTDKTITVKLRNFPGSRKVTCASTCNPGDRLYPTTNGQVDTLGTNGLGTAGAALGPCQFRALEACATAGGIVEALPWTDKGGLLFSAEGDSSAKGTSKNTEDFFDINTTTIPANTLLPGDVLKVKARFVVTAQNGTDTADFQLYLGTVKIVDCAARDLDATEEAVVDATIVITDIGAVGHVKGFGSFSAGDLVAYAAFSLASTALDTTAAAILRGSVTFSASNAGNAAKLRDLIVELVRQ